MNDLQHSHDILDAEWLSLPEGQLHVDVSETHEQIIIRSAIAGVSADELDITLNDDTLTIRGERHHAQEDRQEEIHVQECHWGSFSRSIILPEPVDEDAVDATLKKGILTIRMYKKDVQKRVNVIDLDDM